MWRRFDLMLITALAGLQVALVFLGVGGPVRVASGFVFLALLPGYSFLTVCYRRYRQDYNLLEQVALAVPVSLAISAVLGMLLNRAGLAFRAEALVVWMGLFTCGLAAIGMVRAPAGSGPDRRFVAVASGIAGIALGLGLVAHGIAPQTPDHRVNLYVLDTQGQIAEYPAVASAKVPIQMRVGVTYQGPAEQRFQLVSSTGAQIPLTLQPGARWEAPMDVVLTQPGLQQVSWSLYGSDMQTPDRSVHLWVKVR
jgi:uncharacterized membrane protein